MASRRKTRPVDGIVVLDKGLGHSSNHALQRVKHLLQADKAGHTGALDPLATGVLPLCFGDATKVSQILLDSDKTYLATLTLGVTTASGDRDGEVLSTNAVPAFSPEEIEHVLAGFRGTVMQTAPIYSALKQNGVPQYKLARAGLPVEPKTREVTIYSLVLERWEHPAMQISVRCSKGTYIRSLAMDIGDVLGVGAHLSGLRRTQAGPFTLEHSHTLESLQALAETGGLQALDALLLPADYAVQSWPALHLDADTALRLWQGQQVSVPAEAEDSAGMFRVYWDTRFVGIVERLTNGQLLPTRLMKYEPQLFAGPENG